MFKTIGLAEFGYCYIFIVVHCIDGWHIIYKKEFVLTQNSSIQCKQYVYNGSCNSWSRLSYPYRFTVDLQQAL